MPSELTPRAAFDLLQGSNEYVYLDVRTVQEFVDGRPAGAWNVPILERDPRTGQMQPNARFLAVVQAHFPKDKKLLVGCKSGGRSAAACNLLEAAGYQHLWNVAGGFVGKVSPGGEWIERGWSMLGLPVEEGASGAVQYAALEAGKAPEGTP